MPFQFVRPDINLDFVGKRRIFALISSLFNAAAILLMVVVGLNYGVDFAGGSLVQVQFQHETNARRIRAALRSLRLGDMTVQDFGSSGHSYLVRFAGEAKFEHLGPEIEQALSKDYGAGEAKVVRVESVGAKVGRNLRRDGILAVLFATIFMGIFIAFQFRNVSWSFGAGAVIALVHDVLVVLGALVVTQLQFNLATLAALLTVIGYSVNDTIIVSDRVREDALKRRREPLATLLNRAINETLSRTLLTSGTAAVVLLSLFLFGGPILRPPAFTLLIGVIVGTYSSIYIAIPVVLFWERRVQVRGLSRAG